MKDISDKLIKDIFDSIEYKSGLKLINRVHEDSYFIFQFEKNTINSFKIKGLKWSFGLWIRENQEGKINLVFFYMHDWYIDKFKPSYADKSIEEMFDNQSDIDLNNKKLIDFIDKVSNELKYIKSNSIDVFSKYYCPLNTNKYINYIKCLYDVKVLDKLDNIKENKLKYIVIYWLIIKTYFKYFKNIHNIKFKIINRDGIIPKFIVQLIINKRVDDEELYKSIYHYFVEDKYIYNVRLETHGYFEDVGKYKSYFYG